MTENTEPSGAQKAFGDFAPAKEALIEAITHLAFYAGWPKAYSAMTVAKRVFRGDQG